MRFLEFDPRAPSPDNPFLNERTLAQVQDLIETNKIERRHEAEWGKGVGSLTLAHALTRTKKETARKLYTAAENLAKCPDTDPITDQSKIRQIYHDTIAGFYSYLKHVLPQPQQTQYPNLLEEEGQKKSSRQSSKSSTTWQTPPELRRRKEINSKQKSKP